MLRIVKRGEMPRSTTAAIKLAAIILALICSAGLILSMNLNPLEVFSSLVKGAFGTEYRIKETIIKAIPLIITSLGIAIAFKMQFWNIGGEGQIAMGAFLASWLALSFPTLARPVLLLLMIIAGMVGGGLWAFIPAFFRAHWKTNETIVTLMMNYIALKYITYLQYGPWKDPRSLGFPKIPNFSVNAILPNLGGIHLGWVIALLLIAVVYVFFNHTKKGYEISVLGESENTAQYAGIDIKKTIYTAVFFSGALCGVAGMIQASAVSNTLSVEISGGYGYTAIITTWLANLHPPLILIVSVLFAALIQGGSFIQTAFGIPQAAASLLQGMILFFVLGSEFFTRYTLVWSKPHVREGGHHHD